MTLSVGGGLGCEPQQLPKPVLAIISVCLNDGNVLPLFIENMKNEKNPHYVHVLVDNGSKDGSPELFRKHFDSAIIIESESNLGTTGAYNLGIQSARKMGAEYVLFLALDVLLAPDCLDVLLGELIKDPSIGAIGPVLFKSHDRDLIECMGFAISRDWKIRPNFGGQRGIMCLPRSLDADYIDGGSALFRMSALDKCGTLDERLFIYGEDVDICLRLKKLGFRIVSTARTSAWHRHTEIRMNDRRLRPYQVFYGQRNLVYLAKKHNNYTVRHAHYLSLLKHFPRQFAYYALREHSFLLSKIYLEALWDGFTNKMGKTKYVQ